MTQLAGTDPDQLPPGHMLGRLAYADPDAVVLEPQPSATPQRPGDMVFQLTSNTSITIKVRGSDNVVRSASLVLT